MRHFVWAVLIFIFGSGLTAILLLARQDSFGAGDLVPFFFWLVPIAIVGSLIANTIVHFLSRLSTIFRFVLMVIAGLLYGLISSFLPLFCFGPWMMAFSFSLPLAIISGSIAAFISVTNMSPQQGKKYVLDLFVMVTLAFVVVFLSESIDYFLTGNVTVKMTFIEWQIASQSRRIEDPLDLLNHKEEQKIQAMGLQGKLISRGQNIRGIGPQVHMIIIITRHRIEPISLPIPKRDTVVFIVEETDWSILPENTPLFDRALQLEMPIMTGNDYGRFTIEYPDGSRSTGNTFVWSTPVP